MTLPQGLVRLSQHCFIICPVTFVNTAFISVSGHWGGPNDDADKLQWADRITLYITNHYSSKQHAGAYLYVLERFN